MDSGTGLLAAAAAVRRLRPDADLVLSSDPDGMPWGPRSCDDIVERALAVARAEGISARELAPFAQGIGAILPPLFQEWAEDVDGGSYSGEGNPLTSAVSTMAHVVHASEAHGIDASVMRAAEALAVRAVDRGHGAEGFTRVTQVLGRA